MSARTMMKSITTFSFALALGLLLSALAPSVSSSQTCEGLFKTAHAEEFLRTNDLQNEVRNPAARILLIQMLASKLPKGAFDADVDGRTEGLTVYVDGRGQTIQMRLSSGHLMTTDPTPLMQSQFGGAKGSRTGLAVQLQLLDGEKLAITNTIFSGDENTYLGLTKKVLRTEFDLGGGPITEMKTTETVTTTSVYKKDDVTYAVEHKIKILGRR